MPLQFFICPDGGTIAINECLMKAGCRLVNEGVIDPSTGQPYFDRCVPRAILQEQTKERRYEGHVSVTGMEKDPLYHWLKEKVAYGMEPTMGAPRYIGNAAHYLMEKNPAPETMPEVKVHHELYSGTSDLVSVDEWNGEYVLSDIKTRSTFRYAAMIGLKKVMVPDPSGAVYKRGGTTKTGRVYRKGQPRMVEEWQVIPSEADMDAEIRQCNYYRMAWEANGYKIGRMEIVVIIRDYGQAAKRQGIEKHVKRIPVPFIDDEELVMDAAIKQSEVAEWMTKDEMPPMCSDEARWYGKLCAEYCDVREICPYGGENAVFVTAPQGAFEDLPDWSD